MSTDSAAFTAYESIKAGEWDNHLLSLFIAIQDRQEIKDHTRKPRKSLPQGQVWVWMNAPANQWEPRGTGVIL